MRTSKRASLGIIFLTIFINMVGFGVVIPVLPFYAERFGATPLQIGWLFGIFSLIQFIFSPLLGMLSDRFGRRPVLMISALGTAAGFIIMGAGQTLTMLFVGRIIDGLSGGSIGTAQAYMADITAPEERSRAMGLIGAAFGLGFVFGPALGGATAAYFGHSAPMFLAGGMALVNAFLIYFLLPESLPKDKRSAQLKEPLLPNILKHVQRAPYFTVVATYFILITGFSIMTAIFALFVAHQHRFDEKATGYLFAMLGIIGVIIQGGLIGRLVKRFGEASLAAAGAIILAGSLFAMPFTTTMLPLLLACAGIAIGNSLLSPTLSGIASRSVDAEWQGRALGILQSAGSLARWIGPVMGGWLLHFDLHKSAGDYARTPFWVAAGLLVVTFFLCLRLAWTKRDT
jgi:DHA1 family tetracycline resistance protein-like MFS transporter